MQPRLDHEFFRRDPVICARELIGATFEWDGCLARIVETEAYAADGDPACHTFFRPGARDFVQRNAVGKSYVYLNYGIHWLFNILTKTTSGNGFVLFRALQPLAGIAEMQDRRRKVRITELCSGPGKLTQALGISGADHEIDFLASEGRGIFLSDRPVVAASPRIGISRGREFPWRFTEAGSPFVSC